MTFEPFVEAILTFAGHVTLQNMKLLLTDGNRAQMQTLRFVKELFYSQTTLQLLCILCLRNQSIRQLTL
jgi:hypothetical protein